MNIATNDPIGLALLDFLNETITEDIQIESNLTEGETIPVNYLFRTETVLPEKERFALSLAEGRVLDVGAGSGCHSIILQKQYEVVALDQSAGCCEAMKMQGVKKVVQKNFQDYTGEKFDTILLLMNGFGIAGTLDNMDAFLQHCNLLLNKGGRIIGESVDILYMFENEDGSYSIDLNGGYYGEMRYRMHYRDHHGEWFDWLYISSELLIEIAERNGFKVLDFFEGEADDYVLCLEKVS